MNGLPGCRRGAPPASLLGCACLLLTSTLFGAVTGQATVQTVDPDDVRPGMKGYGLTVFRGTRPERFGVEVIDVIRNFRPSQDLLLIRTEHPVLERAKVVAGMSGSPIYLEGKLAGAYAYGWGFGTEPVAGVTPIKNMLHELRRPLDPEIWRILGSSPLEPVSRSRKRASRVHTAAREPRLPAYLGGQQRDALWALRAAAPEVQPAGRLQPAHTPLLLGGFTGAATEALRAALEPYALLPLQGGGSGGDAHADDGSAQAYVDGGAIGVQLIRGDVNATAVGTVTHVVGKKLVGFGHPMMNMGQTAMPTTTARVLHVLSSLRRSFKMARPIAPLGAMVNDRQAAIVVDADMRAQTIPVHLRVHGVPGAPRDEWNMEVASGRSLTPALVFAGLLNALQATAAGESDVVFRAESRVRIPGHGEIRFRDHGHLPTGASGPMTLARLRAFSAIEAAYGNPFARARVDRVDIDLHIEQSDEVYTIVDASVAHQEVDPGSAVDVYVTLRQFNGKERVRRVQVTLPPSTAGEKIQIQVAAGNQVSIELPVPRSLGDILDGLKRGYPPTSLVVSTNLPSKGLKTRGHVARRLPGSALDALQARSASDRPVAFITQQRTEMPIDRIVYGSAKLQLQVREEPRR